MHRLGRTVDNNDAPMPQFELGGRLQLHQVQKRLGGIE